jgi:hypothetical protein
MNGTPHQKVVHELKEMLALFLYLALFFCTFTTYRRLIEHEIGVSYFHYGFALLKALVLAKVILLGQLTRLSKRLDERPLIVPTFYKVIVFALFTMAFEILEHAIGNLFHGKPMMDAIAEILSVGRDELLARTLVVLVAFLPLFAFREIDRIMGEGRLYDLFLKKRQQTGQNLPPAGEVGSRGGLHGDPPR